MSTIEESLVPFGLSVLAVFFTIEYSRRQTFECPEVRTWHTRVKTAHGQCAPSVPTLLMQSASVSSHFCNLGIPHSNVKAREVLQHEELQHYLLLDAEQPSQARAWSHHGGLHEAVQDVVERPTGMQHLLETSVVGNTSTNDLIRRYPL
eukprot:92601-Amphidinium_carterae.2